MRAAHINDIAAAVLRLQNALRAAGLKGPAAIVVTPETAEALRAVPAASDGFVTFQNGAIDATTGHFKARPIIRVVGVEFISQREVGKLAK